MVAPNCCGRQANHLRVRILAHAILRRKRLTAVYNRVYDEGLTAAASAVFGSAEATG
jgi:hypothetical protein